MFSAILRHSPLRKPTTIKDVARACGFAPSTVSIALNASRLSEQLRPDTVKRIKRAALKLGYRPHEQARSLVTQRSQTIGVLVVDLSDPFCTLILRGIDQQLQSSGYLPVIMDAHNTAAQFARCVDILIERRVEALIVVANWLLDTKPLRELTLRRDIPCVVVGRDFHRFHLSSVLVDNEDGAMQAFRHIYDLGHREIGFVIGPTRIGDSSKRWAGIQRFAASSGLLISPESVRRMPNVLDPMEAFDAGRTLGTDLLKTNPRLTALVCFDDLSALGVVRALRDLGRTVPDDCSVIGFDDVPFAALVSPGLTTIRQPMGAMGELAAQKALHTATRGDLDRASLTLLKPEIVVRQSTAPPSA